MAGTVGCWFLQLRARNMGHDSKGFFGRYARANKGLSMVQEQTNMRGENWKLPIL